MLVLLLLSACAGSPDTGDTAASDTTALTDPNNYTFTGAIDVPSTTTVSGADVRVCWAEVLHDLQCHGLDPLADIDNVGLVRFSALEEPEVEAALSANRLQQADISGYVEAEADGSGCTNLASMSFFGTQIDVTEEYTEAGGAYLLLLTEGTTPGVGARMLAFLDPSSASDVTEVSVPDGCGMLEVDADLTSLTAVTLGPSPWTVDWSGLTRDGQGNPLVVEDIDSLMLGFYEGRTPAELAAGLLDLETSATSLYTRALGGETSADLADATGTGGAFAGLSGDGTWLLALRCSRCYNPAPVFLTVLESP